MTLLNPLYEINNMIVFAFVGVVIKLFFGGNFSQDGTSGRATSTVWGYGVVVLSILSVMVITFALGAKNGPNLSLGYFSFFKGLLSYSFPSVFTVIVLLWIITMNLTYYTRINQGAVATEYYMFSNATTTLLILQLIALFKYLNGKIQYDETLGCKGTEGENSECYNLRKGNDRMAFAIYFVTFMNLVLAGIMNIILAYFSTDG
jgi:hypothetical protein